MSTAWPWLTISTAPPASVAPASNSAHCSSSPSINIFCAVLNRASAAFFDLNVDVDVEICQRLGSALRRTDERRSPSGNRRRRARRAAPGVPGLSGRRASCSRLQERARSRRRKLRERSPAWPRRRDREGRPSHGTARWRHRRNHARPAPRPGCRNRSVRCRAACRPCRAGRRRRSISRSRCGTGVCSASLRRQSRAQAIAAVRAASAGGRLPRRTSTARTGCS